MRMRTSNYDMIMINFTTLPNHSQSFILESRDYFSQNFTIFIKTTELNYFYSIQCHHFETKKWKKIYPGNPWVSNFSPLHITQICSLIYWNHPLPSERHSLVILPWITHVSKSKTAWLWRRFTKKFDTMKFTCNEIKFDFTHDAHQKFSKSS